LDRFILRFIKYLYIKYQVLNETGFRKILKKFDKTAGWKASPIYMEKVAQYHWSTSTKLNHILSSTEKLFISEFAEGHRRKGMSKLRTPEREESYTPTAWRIGFYTGLSLAFFAHILQLTTDPEVIRALPNIYYNLQMYACMSLPILFCLGFAINTLVWHRSHINYKFIFEFDSRDNMSYNEFAEVEK
jgi:hypothetical protein